MHRKVIIYLLLISLANTMFFPEINSKEHPLAFPEIEEINSVIEYLNEVYIGTQDLTPEDEDDNIPDPLKTSRIIDWATGSLYIYRTFHAQEIKEFKVIFRQVAAEESPIEVPLLPPEVC